MNDLVQERLGASHQKIAEFCLRWSVSEFALFGSAVRDDFRDDSDVDVLLSFSSGRSPELHDLMAMEEELRTLFGRKVDLVEKRLIGPNPYRRYNILADHQVLYPEAPHAVDAIREGPSRFDRDLGYIWDMIKAGKEVVEITRRDDVDHRLRRLAIERLLSIIGQAARGLSTEFRAVHSEIPWADIIAERNILVHNYRGVEEEKVWEIALAAVPSLIQKLEPLVANPPGEPE